MAYTSKSITELVYVNEVRVPSETETKGTWRVVLYDNAYLHCMAFIKAKTKAEAEKLALEKWPIGSKVMAIDETRKFGAKLVGKERQGGTDGTRWEFFCDYAAWKQRKQDILAVGDKWMLMEKELEVLNARAAGRTVNADDFITA